MIQVIGSCADPHVNCVLAHLKAIGNEYRVLDIFDSQSHGLSSTITPDVDLCLAAGISTEAAKVVWWRVKPSFYVATKDIVDYYDQEFALREWLAVLDFTSTTYKDAKWVNPRQTSMLASSKIRQLALASECGFRVPRTLFSNNAEKVREFVDSLDVCVHKTITPYICPNGRLKYTTVVNSTIISECYTELQANPSIFQEYIRPAYELRVTAVGDKFFVARIDKRNRGEPDWRTEISDDIYTVGDLDISVTETLLRLHRTLGLAYAAYDFVVTEDSELVFLEVNPAGQWLWIEQRLELQISAALAQYLARHDH